MKQTIKTLLEHLIPCAFLISLISLIISNGIIYFWKRDAFDMLELMFLPLLSSVIIFIVIAVVNSFLLPKYYNESNLKNSLIANIFVLSIIHSFAIIGFSIFFDWVLFSVDHSVSIEYAETLEKMLNEQHSEMTNDIEEFAQLPFLIQNIFMFSFSVILTTILSVFSIRKQFNKTLTKLESM